MTRFVAHVRDTGEIQSCKAHSEHTGELAAGFLSEIGLGNTGRFLGLIHDMGKFTDEFREYIFSNGPRGSVNHTFSAVRYLFEQHHQDANSIDYVVAEILAVASGAHHGLFDCIDEVGKSGFVHRLQKPGVRYPEAFKNFLSDVMSEQELRDLYQKSVLELEPVIAKIQALADMNPDCQHYDSELMFYISLLCRLLLSAVIDGDRRDTAEFCNQLDFPEIKSVKDRQRIWQASLAKAEANLLKMSSDSDINQARDAISNSCRAAAGLPPGVFRFNAPTGGGKTLSGLRFSLAHAGLHQMQRVVFTAPMLTILDQNAQVIRDFICDNDLILEHHSNLTDLHDRSLLEHELLAETWDKEILITTAVQLLDTLFDGGTRSIRRFHALSNSVIVIDEVQAIPRKMLTEFSLAVNFLCSVCHSSVILCSATQPVLESITHAIRLPIRDLCPSNLISNPVFRRMEIKYLGSQSLEGIGGSACDILDSANSLLIVCNKKSQAETLYQDLVGAADAVFYLSAALCPAHRKQVLSDIQKSLKSGRKTVCVSTQVIEAGVDISFESVLRLLAGMDSVVQAMGRGNRNGELGSGRLGKLYLVNCQDENLNRLSEIQDGKRAALALLAEFERHPDLFDFRLDSELAIKYYYNMLYRGSSATFHDYELQSGGTLYDLLSLNFAYRTRHMGPLNQVLAQAFKTAGQAFQVFDNSKLDVIAPFGRGKEIITELSSSRAACDKRYFRTLCREAREFTVSVYRNQEKRLGLYELPCGICCLSSRHYDNTFGVSYQFVGQSFEFL